MFQFEEVILNFFLSYSAEPAVVYTAIVILMTAGSFGFPISEEIVIISSGLMAFIGSRPDLYPPLVPEASTVTVEWAALVCFLSVFLSDFLVFCLGRFCSAPLQKSRFFSKRMSEQKMRKIQKWIDKYGYFYPALFRFTPGLRFAGHFSSGIFKMSFSQFILVDGVAALLVVPTQVLLIGRFGYTILEYLKEVIFGIGLLVFIFIFVVVIRKIQELKKDGSQA